MSNFKEKLLQLCTTQRSPLSKEGSTLAVIPNIYIPYSCQYCLHHIKVYQTCWFIDLHFSEHMLIKWTALYTTVS